MSRDNSHRPGRGAKATTGSWAAATTVPSATGGAAFGLSSIQCPDCGARPVGIWLTHADTCPLARGVDQICDDDGDWFEAHPGAVVRIRPVTPAEVADLLAVGGARPTGHVRVLLLAPGLRSRCFEYEDGAR